MNEDLKVKFLLVLGGDDGGAGRGGVKSAGWRGGRLVQPSTPHTPVPAILSTPGKAFAAVLAHWS